MLREGPQSERLVFSLAHALFQVRSGVVESDEVKQAVGHDTVKFIVAAKSEASGILTNAVN